MKNFISIAFLVFFTSVSFAQTEQRKQDESVEQFADRLKPEGSTITHKVLETKWNNLPVIISLYDQPYKLPVKNDPDQQIYHKVVGSVFIQLNSNKYKKTTFGTIDSESGDPFIESVFFANADTDKTKELIIIASWQQQHFDVKGTLFGTFVFDYDLTKDTLNWEMLNEISGKLEGGCECVWSDGTSKKAKFKTALEIKKELNRLGFK
jgi:hypothetical protein